MVSSKAVSENLNLKFRSKLIHDFTNHGCFHSVIPKYLYGFKGKRAHEVKVVNFSFKMFKMRLSRFLKCLKTT